MTEEQKTAEINWDKESDWRNRPGFVDRGYIYDPETEELLFDGTYLCEGMRILMGNVRFMRDLSLIRTNHDAELALDENRWCTISHVREERTPGGYNIAFFATYDDGTKIKRQMPIHFPWIVKKHSIVSDVSHEHNEECYSYFPGFPVDLVCEDIPSKSAIHPLLETTTDPWEATKDNFERSNDKIIRAIELKNFLRNPSIFSKRDLLRIAETCRGIERAALTLASKFDPAKSIKMTDVTSYHPDLSTAEINKEYGKKPSPKPPKNDRDDIK